MGFCTLWLLAAWEWFAVNSGKMGAICTHVFWNSHHRHLDRQSRNHVRKQGNSSFLQWGKNHGVSPVRQSSCHPPGHRFTKICCSQDFPFETTSPYSGTQADSPVQKHCSFRASRSIWKLLSWAPHHMKRGIMLFAAPGFGDLVPSSRSWCGLGHLSRALLRARTWCCDLQLGSAHANMPGGFYQGVTEIIHWHSKVGQVQLWAYSRLSCGGQQTPDFSKMAKDSPCIFSVLDLPPLQGWDGR